jgi:hypothetical protein
MPLTTVPLQIQQGHLVRVRDRNGCCPLHLALRSATDPVISAVLKKWPEAAKMDAAGGDSCLRLALCRVNTSAAELELGDLMESESIDEVDTYHLVDTCPHV